MILISIDTCETKIKHFKANDWNAKSHVFVSQTDTFVFKYFLSIRRDSWENAQCL